MTKTTEPEASSAAPAWRGDPRDQRYWVGRAVDHFDKVRADLVAPTGGTEEAPTWDREAVRRAIDAAAGPAMDVCRALLVRMRGAGDEP